jgi:hypothetical protein
MSGRNLAIVAGVVVVAVAAAFVLRLNTARAERTFRDEAAKAPVPTSAGGALVLPNVDVQSAKQSGTMIDAVVTISNADPTQKLVIDPSDLLDFEGTVNGTVRAVGARSVGPLTRERELAPGGSLSMTVTLTSPDPVSHLRVQYQKQQGGFTARSGPSALAAVTR